MDLTNNLEYGKSDVESIMSRLPKFQETLESNSTVYNTVSNRYGMLVRNELKTLVESTNPLRELSRITCNTDLTNSIYAAMELK